MFQYSDKVKANNGQVIYVKDENSFDFDPSLSADFSILVGYLNITFDTESKLARQIWGLSPLDVWIEKPLVVPTAMLGGLLLVSGVEMESGECQRIVDVNSWKTFYDKCSGWVCIGDPKYDNDETAVEFAKDTISVLRNNTLKSLWLKPVFV
ncbi:hypothetical protein ACN6AX_02135 [Paenibacillus polymyxa]|uniref:hypothetical protein n=1 Tax=Paenibacillus polymyxa TaxID=1406 RepID=UPI00211D4F91|nr:hypothetical protein [Paenibacillus polymyxa]